MPRLDAALWPGALAAWKAHSLTMEGSQVVVPQVHQILQRRVELLQDTLQPGRNMLMPFFLMPRDRSRSRHLCCCLAG